MQINYFCLNLKRRKDRWSQIKSMCKISKININRVESFENKRNPEMWCALSHRKVIQIALEKKYPYVCVFEDDVKILKPEYFKRELQLALKELPEKWGILYLGWLIQREWKLTNFSKNLLKVEWMLCTYGIVYSANLYERISSAIHENGEMIEGYRAIDLWFAEKIQKELPCFISKKILTSETGSASDIQKRQKNIMTYSMRFFLYKNNLRWLCLLIWQIWDLLKISSRSRNKR